MRWRQFSSGAAIVLCAGYCAIPGAAQEFPFRTVGGYGIVVEGSIAGVGGANLLVDTGSQRSVIDRRRADKLSGARTPARVAVIGQRVQVEQFELPELEFGPVRVAGLSVLIEDLSSLDRAWGVHLDGIIGMDVLRRRNFTVDFAAQCLRFGPLPTLENSVLFPKDLPYVLLSVRLDGNSARLLFDTGMKDALVFESRLRQWDVPLEVPPNSAESFTAPERRFRLSSVRIGNLRLGSENLGPQELVLAAEENTSHTMDGFLGAFILHARVIAIDFENGVFSWSRAHEL